MTRRAGMATGDGLPKRTSFHTPDKAATGSSTLNRSFSTSRQGKSSSRTRTSLPSSASTLRFWKNPARSESRSQPTLTQIDFVTKTQEPGPDDSRLDYIEVDGGSKMAEPQNAKEVITIDDDDDDDEDYTPGRDRRSLSEANRRARSVRFEQVDLDEDLDGSAPKRRRISYAGSNERLKSARSTRKKKSSTTTTKERKKGKASTSTVKKDKTLTQMRFVQRIITIDSDEADLEYSHPAPKTQVPSDGHSKRPETQVEHSKTPGPLANMNFKVKHPPPEPEPSESPEDAISESRVTSLRMPMTPQKLRNLEIPSSQSPESPGLAPVSSPPVSGVVRSPLKCVSPNVRIRVSVKKSASQTPRKLEYPVKAVSNEPTCSASVGSSRELSSGLDDTRAEPPSVHSAPNPKPEAHHRAITEVAEPEPVPVTTQRTVIYDTDAETEYSDVEDALGHDPADADDSLEGVQDQLEEDSQELPPPPELPSEIDQDTDVTRSDTLPPSEASFCYQRLQPATQFPMEPVPRLDSQRMAELFPSQNSPRRTGTANTPLRLAVTPRKQASMPRASGPREQHEAELKLDLQLQLQLQTQIQGQTQTQTQTQTQGQNSPHPLTEIVPESSPIPKPAENYETSSPILPRSMLRQSVVQVESSQPADRLIRRITSDQNSGPRGIFSKSQLLTSSLMESVPLVPFWMGSQDSVGEPYSMPDG